MCENIGIMSERTRVYFVTLSDNPDPAVISTAVGREPSTFRPIGEPITRQPGAALRRRSSWTIETGLPASSSFEDQLEALLAELEQLPGIASVAERFDAGIACYAWREIANPGFHISARQIRRAADLNLSIDFDIYTVEADTSEP